MKEKLTKEEFAKKMKAQRESLFDLANSQLSIIVSDPHKFTSFLALMATINYTVNNSLLVYAQKPYAKELKSLDKWQEINVKVNKGEKGIQILEPSGEFIKRDGSKGISYSPRYVFDISQTSCHQDKEFNVSLETIRQGLLDNNCPIVVSSDPTQLSPVEYDAKANQINVLEGISFKEELNGLFKAYAYKEGLDMIDSSKIEFISSCVGYMLSIRFHVPSYNTFPFTGVMDRYFKNLDPRAIKNELNMIYKVYKPIKDRINYGIYTRK